jgi:hypothetical protein
VHPSYKVALLNPGDPRLKVGQLALHYPKPRSQFTVLKAIETNGKSKKEET